MKIVKKLIPIVLQMVMDVFISCQVVLHINKVQKFVNKWLDQMEYVKQDKMDIVVQYHAWMLQILIKQTLHVLVIYQIVLVMEMDVLKWLLVIYLLNR